jgi:hypothetical protein
MSVVFLAAAAVMVLAVVATFFLPHVDLGPKPGQPGQPGQPGAQQGDSEGAPVAAAGH